MMHKYIKFFALMLTTMSMNGGLLAGESSIDKSAPKLEQKHQNKSPKSPIDSSSQSAVIAEGKTVFAQCSACHLASGDGVKGAFPPLKNRLASLSATTEGRLYLQSVLLQGLNGPIKVDEISYNGYMQAYGGSLSDQQISAVLNYVAIELADQTSPDFDAYSADEVAATRLHLKAKAKSSNELRKNAIN